MEPLREIILTENDDGSWTARDVDAERSTEGDTRLDALDALDDVVAAAHRDASPEPTDDDLHELTDDRATDDARDRMTRKEE